MLFNLNSYMLSNMISQINDGLLELACTTLRHKPCNWLVHNYDIDYHCLKNVHTPCNPCTIEDVSLVMGIPSRGVDVIVHNRRSTYP